MKCGKTGRLHLNVVVAGFIHRYVLNGCCVPDIGLGPGTDTVMVNRQSPPLHGAHSVQGRWVLAECLVLFCAASPPYRLAHCPKQTPGLQPVQGS